MKIEFSVTLVVLSLALATALPYTKDSGVINLNKDNFANTVFSNEHVWIVEFYAPCGHCKNLAPEYEKLAKDMKGIIKVAAINCDEDKELAGYFGVKGFPTIKIFPSNAVPTKDGKGFEKKPEDYNGQRTAAAMANAALSKLASFVTTVKSASDLDATSDLAKVVLFTDKDKTTNLYKGLSVEFHNQLEFLEVRKNQKELAERFEVTKFPTLLVLKPSGDSEVFSGKLAFDSIYKFLKPHAKKIQNQSSSSASSESEKPAAPVEFEYDVRDEVKDQNTFDNICAAGKTCIIAFLDPTNSEADEHKRYLELLESVSEKHKKVVNFIWMDGLKQTEFVDEFRLHSGFPSAILFNHKKSIMAPYFGSFSEEPLSEYAESITSGGIRRASSISKMPKVLSGAARKDEL